MATPQVTDRRSSDVKAAAISLCSVSKVYEIGRMTRFNLPWGGQDTSSRLKQIRAVDNVSLEIGRGETVGILGVNGAGKSTLLQLITQILRPTEGTVNVTGRISALIELGSGFNPEWTGRQNAEMQCMLNGIPSDEIADKMQRIEAFAEVGEHFDLPMRLYSSGLFARVAFASSIAVDPDILIVDEALAVGDVRFQNKCYANFQTLQQRGCTILFVTHSPDIIGRFCTRSIVMHQGRVGFDGAPRDAIEFYHDLIHVKTRKFEDPAPSPAVSERTPVASETVLEPSINVSVVAAPIRRLDTDMLPTRPYYNSMERRTGTGYARILDVAILDANGEKKTNVFDNGEMFRAVISVAVDKPIAVPYVGTTLKTKDNLVVCGANTHLQGLKLAPLKPGDFFTVEVVLPVLLSANSYFLDVGCGGLDEIGDYQPADWRMSALHIVVRYRHGFFGIADLGLRFREIARV